MKITQVRAHVLRSALEQPFAFSQGWVSSRGATLVEVQTDDGVTGWGEALCQGLQPPEIAAAAIQHSAEARSSSATIRCSPRCCGTACTTTRATTARRAR